MLQDVVNHPEQQLSIVCLYSILIALHLSHTHVQENFMYDFACFFGIEPEFILIPRVYLCELACFECILCGCMCEILCIECNFCILRHRLT